MADETQEESEEKKGGGAMKFVVMIVGAIAMAGLGAGGTYFLTGAGGQPEAAAGETEEGAEAAAAAAEAKASDDVAERLVPLEPVVVNLGGSGAPRYLKASIELEVMPGEDRERVEKAMPLVRDSILVLLSSQRLADLQAFEGKVLLKEEIVDRVNGALGHPAIESVFFTEFIVQ